MNYCISFLAVWFIAIMSQLGMTQECIKVVKASNPKIPMFETGSIPVT